MNEVEELNISGLLGKLPKWAKQFLTVFVLVLSFGYVTGLVYISKSTGVSSGGIEEQYLGNENDLDALEMKFKKPEKAILTLVHGHVVSFSLIFFALGGIFMFSSYSNFLKKVLTIEPLLSTVTTFGGIWLMWLGYGWMKYVVMISGTLMHVSFAVLVVLVLRDLSRKNEVLR